MLRKFVNLLKNLFPGFFQLIFRLRDALRNIPAWRQLSLLQKNEEGLSVTYLSEHFPKPPVLRNEFAHGGAVKLTYLAENLPHHFPAANLLYAVITVAHPLQIKILETAKQKDLKVVINRYKHGLRNHNRTLQTT